MFAQQKSLFLFAAIAAAAAIAALLAFPHPAHAALSRTERIETTRGSSLDGGDITSSSFTPNNNSLLVVVFGGTYEGDDDADTDASMAGGGLTWTKRVTISNEADTWTSWVTIWTAPVTTGSSMTVQATNSLGNMNGTHLLVYEYTGYNTATPIGGTATGLRDGGDNQAFSITLNSSPVATSEVLGTLAINSGAGGPDLTAGTGWSETFRSIFHGSETSAQAQIRSNSTSVSVDWGAVDSQFGMVGGAIEIKAAPTRFTLSKPPNNLGLVGYWSFNEGTGTKATDFSGRGNTGTLTDGPTWVNGKRGKALNFDGADDYVAISNHASLNPTASITVSAWIRADTWDGGNARILQKGSGDDQYRFLDDGDVLKFDMAFVIGGAITTALPSPLVWHHVVATYDGATIAIYVDGSLANSAGASGSISTTADNLVIGDKNGAGATGDHFDGSLDEVRIYNRALSATEVAKLYGSGAVKFTTSSVDLQRGSTLQNGLVGHWTFDGPDVTTTVTDRSGNNNHGYFRGGATSSAKTIGKLGQALDFDGTNNYVDMGQTPSSLNLTGDLTISAWIKPDTFGGSSRGGIVDSGGTGFNGFLFRVDNFSVVNGLTFFGATGPLVSNASVITLGVWQHVAISYTAIGTTATFYVNGVPAGSGGVDAPTPTTENFMIGGRSGDTDRRFDGAIDDVRIYNRALTGAEAKQLYNLGRATVRP